MYKKLLLVLFCGIGLFIGLPGWAQSPAADGKAPKIGLALSGGGAKGLAYIGLLKKIDSLGIKVDYVTGTSMGGVLGGLYAMGYSGKQLETIVNNISWGRVLTNKVPLSQVNIEEKDEYGNYMLELPIFNGKPALPSSMIEGQYLSEILNTYAYPSRNITDFSKLYIPLQITTSDIINGGLVMQKSGSLPLVIRATMAIPAVFSTVYIDGKVLVDGGLDRNFPVDEIKDMGADYVIGGYTGFHILKEKEIKGPLNIIMQTYAFNGVKDSKQQMEKTDLLIDYTDILTGYSSADFAKYKEILLRGEIEANKYLPQLIKLAEQQRANGISVTPRNMQTAQTPAVQYNFLTDRNEKITDPEELSMLRHIWKPEENKFYDVDEINSSIHRLYGTRFYNKVYYTYTNTDKGLEMNIHLKRGEKGHFKTAVHYDTDQSAGIVLNYTYYNLLLNRSRFLATLDATERLKGRISYYKFISPNNKLWVKAHAEYRSLKSNDLLLSLLSTSDVNTAPPDYFTRNFKPSLSFGYSFNPSIYLEGGLSYELEEVYKSKNLVSKILGIKPENTVYSHHNEALFVRLVQNTMSSAYYPVKGNKLETEFKYTFNNRLKIAHLAEEDEDEASIYQYLDPNSLGYNPTGPPGNITRVYLKDQVAVPVSNKLSLKLATFAGFNSSSRFGSNDDTYLYLNNYFGLGGTDERELYSNNNFIGLKQGEVPLRGLTSFTLSAQYTAVKNVYLIPTVSYAAESDGYNVAANLFKKELNYIGYGMHIGYMSIAGPVDFVISKTNTGDGYNFPWRAYLSFGYKF